MLTKRLIVQYDDTVMEQTYTVAMRPGESVLEAAREAGLRLTADCGGAGTCGKCRVRIVEGSVNELTQRERSVLSQVDIDAGVRLACQTTPLEGTVTIALCSDIEEYFEGLTRFVPLTAPPRVHAASAMQPAIAIDLGTTTIATALINLADGAILDTISVVNKQRAFGADVIARIQAAANGNLHAMSALVRGQLADAMTTLCRNQHIGPHDLTRIAIAGNTTMLHILLQLDCSRLGVAPFTPVTLATTRHPASALFGTDFGTHTEVVTLPGISTYVGADIAAGIYCCSLTAQTAPNLFIDIGTNGEMAIIIEGKTLCAATAAGPAFEGGNITWGTGSVSGAIRQVRWQESKNKFDITTIDNAPPSGLCGSGLVDAVYEGVRHGLILPGGRINQTRFKDELPLATTADGRIITLTQKDIRELQFAKSALFSGIVSLLRASNIASDDIDTLYIAGGFGYNLNFASGAGIGLIPPELAPKVKLVGNTALGGAVRFLTDPNAEAELEKIVLHSKEFNLAGDTYFKEAFLENTTFPQNRCADR